MQRAHSIADIPLPVVARPARQSRQPAYLRDYEVQLVGRRPPAQSDVTDAAQYTQGQEDKHQEMREGATRKTSQTSHSVSPISQLDYALIDEWPAAPAAGHFQHPVKPKAQLGKPPGLDHRPARPLVGHDMQGAHADAYSRSSETVHREQLTQSPFAGRIAYHQLPLDAQVSAPNPHLQQCVASAFQPIPLQASTPAPRANSAPLSLSEPSYNHPVYRPQVAPVAPPSSPADTREQFLMDTITKMMSELQAIKEASRPAIPSYQPAPAQSLSQPYDSNQFQYPVSQYPSSSQPYAYGYPQPPGPYQYPPMSSFPLQPTKPPQQTYAPIPTAYGMPDRKPFAFLSERTYRGPIPTIPDFTKPDPSQFTRLKQALGNLLPPDATELFCYQVLLDHLKLEEARLVADAYLHSLTPYTDTMVALTERFGRPQKLALKKISMVMNAADIRQGDTKAFQSFALDVCALVGMLKTLGQEGAVELQCGSHVERLLSKLPTDLRSAFRRSMFLQSRRRYDLMDFSEWLKHEAWCQDSESQPSLRESKPGTKQSQKSQKPNSRSDRFATVLHGSEESPAKQGVSPRKPEGTSKKKSQPYCPYCDSSEHFLSQCDTFKSFDNSQIAQWIKSNRRCWRCGRGHTAAECTLKKPCSKCQGKHLQILHSVNTKPVKDGPPPVTSATETLYLNRPGECSRVLLKVVRVLLQHENKTFDTYAVLDDGSERTILLPAAAQKLGLCGPSETLALRTIRHDVQTLPGMTVTFRVSPITQPNRAFVIMDAFTADRLSLADHTYPVDSLKLKYKHLQDIPLQAFDRVSPTLLIGADNPHLLTPLEPVRLGPPGGPAAIKTRLGWTLQGPSRLTELRLSSQQCLFTSLSPLEVELRRNVEKLWQLDTLPQRCEKQVTRSREDQQAIDLLEAKTIRVEVDGVLRYATPLLWKKNFPALQAPMEAVMPRLRGLEKRLSKDPESVDIYIAEIKKLETSGVVVKLPAQAVPAGGDSWYIPHHVVQHNGKHRIVFDCSFQYQGVSLNQSLLPGPTLSPSLLGVLLRFREHSVGISGDIKGMFHQVMLLPEDRPLLRFIWRDMNREETPQVYEWRVLPFGTTCSPCCATFALQQHVHNHTDVNSVERFSVDRCFYVDNCLQSLQSAPEAKQMVDRLRSLLASGGFEIRQWASNQPEVINHLPAEARSDKLDLWLAHDKSEAHESTLGLTWYCNVDAFSYKSRVVTYDQITMRNVYRVLASQYDPLGFILPYTTRAKILVQRLWDQQRGWDDPNLPEDLLAAWHTWEGELEYLPEVQLPRCYTPAGMDRPDTKRDIHVFCDASERAYGAVTYLRSEDVQGRVHVAFLLARSRVAPRKQLSMPRLELCAAVTGAQLARLLRSELTLEIRQVVLWSDSTTVLTWLHSESCRFKVFVGTRVAEIQDLTDLRAWRYIESSENPADDLTRGKPLQELATPNRWCDGPEFLKLPPDKWPTHPSSTDLVSGDPTELKRFTFCGLSTATDSDMPTFKSWKDLVESLAQELHGAANHSGPVPASTYQAAERLAFQKAQKASFPEDCDLLQKGKPVASSSHLLCLSPEFDSTHQVIRVGGRLRRVEGLDPEAVHPIVLDPAHPYTRLLIQEYDSKLCHPGPERVFAELRRRVWILRGREAVKRHQRRCTECCRWRSRPAVQKMADLPPPRLRLFKPAFYSCGMDCFGPLTVKVGRRTEKRWGLLFKCLTTRAVHVDLLTSIDLDSFLMALRRFIARRGKPSELYSDQGTNFRGGENELVEAFSKLSPEVQQHLASQQISFHFNPPAAPHFGGVWEREIRSVKAALYTTIGSQTVSEEVLQTVLIEIESILNSKPLGYVSANIADLDPVTPNSLLMGRPDSALPQVVYPQTELLGRRRWRHSQVLADRFWTAFIRNYLPGLQIRGKWTTPSPDITINSVVMVVDPQLPRSLWQIGKVVKVFPGPDGRVRTVEVQIKDKVYTRPIVRVIVLPQIPDDEANRP
ncbi:uncharacterized protein LOC111190943 [Astyanax mexicanus]|uniref:uncharacterized protein LOC111190943 n=1 Tax=Astyanax mexicanus TaxID=7994 RepID=UPI0020CAB902|nr:uncharacterized protein LOC111190943 [Astyanax mexicanus]